MTTAPSIPPAGSYELLVRARLITAPILDTLTRTFPGHAFTVDDTGAQHRPGSPVTVRWCDGPSNATVVEALAPVAVLGNERATTDARYPVLLDRSASPTAVAYALLLDPAAVTGDVDPYRHALARLSTVSLPGDAHEPVWQRAQLLASIATTAAGQAPTGWGPWLASTDGQAATGPLLEEILRPFRARAV